MIIEHQTAAHRVTAANLVAHLTWDCGTPTEEFHDGRARGFEVALEIGDRGKLMHICAGLDQGPAEFTRRLQLARVEVDPDLSLDLYAALEFGALSGGVKGNYARGFRDGFAQVRPLLALH